MDHGEKSTCRRSQTDVPETLLTLVKTCRPGLTRYLNSIVHDPALAEDLTEEAFVKLLTKRPASVQTPSFKTWLFTVGRNLALDHLRKAKRRGEIPGDAPETLADPTGDPAEAVEAKETRAALRAAMERLHPPYRQVLELTYFEEFTPAQCAKILRMRPRNVSVLLFRAKEALRKELAKEDIFHENG